MPSERRVFGPVPSRRLGWSLGVDPVPFKTCNWNCVYCQLGRTAPLAAERRSFFPPEEVVAEVRAALAREPRVDWVTFVGSGETTLHADLGQMLWSVKGLTGRPVAVITNGSLLHRADVREELRRADAVLPTLDAGTEDLYRRLNRAHPSAPFDRLVDGLVAFRRTYRGRLWVEVMLVRGMNDTAEALRDLAAVLRRVRPDAVHLNAPVRPAAEAWVRPTTEEGLARAEYFLGDVATVVGAGPEPRAVPAPDDPVPEVLAILERHPSTEEDLRGALGLGPEAAAAALEELARSGRARVVERGGRRFWCSGEARHGAARGG